MHPNLNNLSFLEQDVIELLIFGDNTEHKISMELLLGGSEVSRSILFDLLKKGLVRKASTYSGYDSMGTWQYCGGPVGDFFKIRQQTLLDSVESRIERSL